MNKSHLTEQERMEYLSKVPQPDRYILLGSSCHLTPDQIKGQYKQLQQTLKEQQGESVEIDTKQFLARADVIEFLQDYTKNKMEELKADPKIGKSGQMVFVLGNPGAGKSSVINSLKENMQAFHADADKLKEVISEQFGIDINASNIHEISGSIMKQYIIPALLDNKINFIQEKIGDEIYKMESYAEDYKSRGYEVSLNLVHCDNNVCRMRNINRCYKKMKEGELPRLVNDDNIISYGSTPTENYIYLMENRGDLFTSGRAFCSDGPDKDTPPQKLLGMSYENGKRVVNEQTEQYVQQGKTMKNIALGTVAESALETLEEKDPKTASEVEKGIDELIRQGDITSEYSPKCMEVLGQINDEATELLIDTLNPSETYREGEKLYDMQQVEQSIKERASKGQDKTSTKDGKKTSDDNEEKES